MSEETKTPVEVAKKAATLNAKDLYPEYRKYFNEAALKALDNHVPKTLYGVTDRPLPQLEADFSYKGKKGDEAADAFLADRRAWDEERVRTANICVYLVVRIDDLKSREAALSHMIALINDLAAEGVIKSSLGALGSITVLKSGSYVHFEFVDGKPVDKSVVTGYGEALFSFFHVPAEKVDEIRARSPFFVNEGEIGEPWESRKHVRSLHIPGQL